MLMEFRDEEIEAMFAKLPEVPIPPNLSQRIAERIENMDRRRHRTKIVQRSIGTVAAGVLLFSGSIMFVPSFAAYAKQIPGLEAAVKWLEGAAALWVSAMPRSMATFRYKPTVQSGESGK